MLYTVFECFWYLDHLDLNETLFFVGEFFCSKMVCDISDLSKGGKIKFGEVVEISIL
jgi:hypothetical protein